MSVRVGQTYCDTYFNSRNSAQPRIAFRVMRLNEKSARVEPCDPDGWFSLHGFMYQYRVPLAQFERGRHVLLRDEPSDA